MDDAGNLGSGVPGGGVVCIVAGVRGAALRSGADSVCANAVAGVIAGGARRGGRISGDVGTRERDCAGRWRVPDLPDVLGRNRNIFAGEIGDGDGTGVCALGIGVVGRWRGAGNLAGFLDAGGDLGAGEIWADALVVDVSGEPIGIRVHGNVGGDYGGVGVCVDPATERGWIFDWMGQALGIVRGGELYGVRLHCDSVGDGDALYCFCAALEQMDDVCRAVRGDFHVYGLAGGVAVSRATAEFFVAGVEKRFGGMVDGVGAVRVRAYHEYGIPELAVRNFGDDCGIVLRVDVEEDRVDIRVGIGTCGGRRSVAFLFPAGVKGVDQENHSLR